MRDLVVARGGATVLQIPSFDLPRGAVTVLVGPNGAGKSSLLLALAHLIPSRQGEIFYDGKRVGHEMAPAQVRGRLAAVFQEPLLLNRTVYDNVALGLALRGASRREMRARVPPWLEALGIAHLTARAARTLSGGEAQRTSLARAFAVDPELLLLDEPFAALDAASRAQLGHDFRAMQRFLGTTTLLVTQDLGEAYFLADRIAVLDQGRILQTDPPGHLFTAPRSRRVAELVGVKNILPGTVISPSCVRVGERELAVPASRFAAGARVVVCIRAERVTLASPETPAAPTANVLAGEVIDEHSDGITVTLLVRLLGPRLRPEQPFDLHLDIPISTYERHGASQSRIWNAVIEPGAMHVVAD